MLLRCLLLFALAVGVSDPSLAVDPFQSDREEFLSTKPAVPALDAQTRAKIARTKFIFVTGFMAEFDPRIFRPHLGIFKQWGVPSAGAEIYWMDSTRTMEKNAEALGSFLLNLPLESDQKLIVFSSSAGGIATMQAIVENSEALEPRLSRVYFSQTPFEGSPMADYLVFGGELSREWPWLGRALFRACAGVAGKVIGLRWGASLDSLTSAGCSRFTKRLVEEHAADLRRLESKMYFISSAKPPSDLGLKLRLPGLYIDSVRGANDGLVPLVDKAPMGLKSPCLTLLGVSHDELILKEFGSDAQQVEATLYAIFRAL